MNERIRQLWEDNDTIEVCYPEQGSPVSVSAMTLEKFAELIVNQVRYTVAENFHKCRTASRMDKIIKEHFGVEE